MDCSSPGPSVHGILQKKNTGVGSHSLLQEISPTQGSNMGLPHCRCILCVWATIDTSTCPQTGTWRVLDHMETHCWTQRGWQEKEITIDRNKTTTAYRQWQFGVKANYEHLQGPKSISRKTWTVPIQPLMFQRTPSHQKMEKSDSSHQAQKHEMNITYVWRLKEKYFHVF